MSEPGSKPKRRRSLLDQLRAWTFVGVAAPMLAATLGVTVVLRYTVEQTTLAQIHDQLDGAWALIDELHVRTMSGALTQGEALSQLRRAFSGRVSLISFRAAGLEELAAILGNL